MIFCPIKINDVMLKGGMREKGIFPLLQKIKE